MKISRWILALVALTALLAAGTTALARSVPDPDCVQKCADQWNLDKGACQDTLDAELAKIDAQLQECLANTQDPVEQFQCQRKANQQKFLAQNQYRRCISHANTVAWSCYRSCPPSASRP